MYRPQFPYSVPDAFQDKDFVHYFDQSNTPQLNNALSLAVGGMILGIPLQLQGDAPFDWRGIKVTGPNGYAVRFRDTSNNYLSNDWVPLDLAVEPEETSVFGSLVIPLEPEIPCPLGSVVLVDVMRQA